MKTRSRRRGWPIVVSAIAALTLASTGSAGHGGVSTDANTFHLATGALANNAGEVMTGLTANVSGPALHVTNPNTGAFASGVSGIHTSTTGIGPGVEGVTNSNSSFAVGVRGLVTSGTAASGSAGVHGINNTEEANGYGVWGQASGIGTGVYGETLDGRGVFGYHTSSDGTDPGVRGLTNSSSDLAAGVHGEAPNGSLTVGVLGSSSAFGVLGVGGAAGVLGYNPSGLAGYFIGNVHVQGTLSKSAGAFRIDHPLEPATKYLQHSFVESPDMKNVYDGVARTDRRGFATVRLPRYFQALNRGFRYQLTQLGKAAWGSQAIVWEKIRSNRFVIRSKPRIEVSWQVTGIRKDTYAREHPIRPEIAKPTNEQERYRLPELYANRAESAIGQALAEHALR